MKLYRLMPSLIVIGLTMAALSAPPSVFADTETTQPPAPATPAPVQPAPPAIPIAPANAIRVGLGRSLAAVEVTAPGGLLVVDQEGLHWQSPPGQAVQLTLVNGQIAVAGLSRKFSALRLVPVPPATPASTGSGGTVTPPSPVASLQPPAAPANPLSYNRKSYRGEVEVLVSPKDKKLNVVNVLNIEEYLLGVVPREVSSEWPAEAVKAQAVAARTYAMAVARTNKYPGEGFELVATTGDQDYGGLSAEKQRSSEAVWLTRGQVVTFNGQFASTFYHSSSGGHTENNEVIYTGAPIAYLRGVPDFDNVAGNSRYAWEYTFSFDEFAKKARDGGYNVGNVVGVNATGTLGASGRPSQWQLAGASGNQLLRGEQLRSMLGIPSSPKQVTIRQTGPGSLTRLWQGSEKVAVVGPGGTVTRTVRGTAVVSGTGSVTTLGPVTAIGGTADLTAGITVTGGGWGHGVGMSQWGAYGMATQGKTYEQILLHYYRGTKLETR